MQSLNGVRGGIGLPLRKIPNEAALMSKRLPARPPTSHLQEVEPAKVSPLVLCDHLIQVAQEADRAGYVQTAAHLVTLVNHMFDTPPKHH